MTILTRLGLTAWATNQQSPHVPVNENAAAGLLFNLAAVGKGTTTPPGSPEEGQSHILGASPTGAWSGFSQNNIAYYHNGAWSELTALDRLLVWVDDGAGAAALWQYDANASPPVWVQTLSGAAQPSPYDVPVGKSGSPAASEVLARYVLARGVEFAANFSGSAGNIGTNPTATYDIDVTDDAVSIGTVSISTGGVFTFTTTSGTAKSVAAGSVLEFVAPAASPPDATAADIDFMLTGTVTLS